MFIVLEGLDGSGKTTQLKLLQQYFETKGNKTRYLHFPKFDESIFGELIAAFLRGEFGNNLDPRLIALLFAGNRKDNSEQITEWLNNKDVVVLDRYVYSNIAFQCAKILDKQKRDELRKWIFELEYKYFGIPKPDLSIFLDVPFSFTEARLTENRVGDDRDYLKGKEDIHEADLELQKRVHKVYLEQAETDDGFIVLNCSKNGEMKSIEEISKSITELINKI